MALPQLETPKNEGQIQEVVKDIATAVFKSAKVSMESAAKAVIPSVPNMVDEILEDLQSGSVRTFNLALDKLDKLMFQLGVDLRKYSKELADFQQVRQEKITQSEQKLQTLREKNIIATIEKSGDLKILSKAEIELKQRSLKVIDDSLKKEEALLKINAEKVQQERGGNTKARREAIIKSNEKIIKLQNERAETLEILNQKTKEKDDDDETSFKDYVPTPLLEIGEAFKQGLLAPYNAIMELGTAFAGLLKPLRIFKPLFKGLLGNLKKFGMFLKASFLSFLPFIAIGALIGVVLFGLYKAIKKVTDFVSGFFGDEEEDKQKGTGKYQSLDEGFNDAIETQDAPTIDRDSKDPKAPFYDPKSKTIIQPDNPDYYDIKKQAYPDDKVIQSTIPKILPEKTSLNMMDRKSNTPIIKPEDLKPSVDEKMASNNSFVNAPVATNVQNNSTLATGLKSGRNDDFAMKYATA